MCGWAQIKCMGVTSSLAMGVMLERCGAILKDACCLHLTNDVQYINLAELDAMLKGLNLMLERQAKVAHLYMDSLCVYYWLTDTLTDNAQVKTKAESEMLVWRRLAIVK